MYVASVSKPWYEMSGRRCFTMKPAPHPMSTTLSPAFIGSKRSIALSLAPQKPPPAWKA